MKTMKKIVAMSLLSSALFIGSPTANATNESCKAINDAVSFSANISACTPEITNGVVTEASYKEYIALLNTFKVAYKDAAQYGMLDAKIKEADKITKVINSIASINPYKVNTFPRSVDTVKASYNALTEANKSYVYNKELLTTYEEAVAIVTEINNIKLTDPAAQYKAKVEAARKRYDSATSDVQNAVGNIDSLSEHEQAVSRIKELEALIAKVNKNPATLTEGQIAEFVADLAAAKTLYTALTSAERKLVVGYDIVTDHEKGLGAAMEVVALIDAISPAATTFAARTDAAKKKYDALSEADKKFVQNAKLLEEYAEPATLVLAINALKTSSKTFEDDVADVKRRFSALTAVQQSYVNNSKLIAAAEQKLVEIEDVEKLIATLASATVGDLMNTLTAVSEAYYKLDSGQRQHVENKAEFSKFETLAKDVLKVEELIAKIDVQSSKLTSQVNTAQKAFDKLTPAERAYVRNASILAMSAPASEFITALSKLRTSSKTYREDVQKLREQYNAFDTTAKSIVDAYEPNAKIIAAEKLIAEANYVDERIARVGEEPEENYIKFVADTRAAYNALSKDARKIVSKYKELQAIEKQIKPILKAAELINALDENPRSLMSAFDKAQKAYAKLKPNQKELVYNFNVLREYEKPVSVSKKIKALKPRSQYFLTDLSTVRQMYEGLTEQQKQQVENAFRITQAELEVKDVNVIVTIIQGLAISSPEYVKDVRSAEQGYKQLVSSYRKLVVNYDRLKEALKTVKSIEKVMKNIDQLQATDPKKIDKKIQAARKAYDKLDEAHKAHVANYMTLVEYETARNTNP